MTDTELDQVLDLWNAPAVSPSLHARCLTVVRNHPIRKTRSYWWAACLAATLAVGSLGVVAYNADQATVARTSVGDNSLRIDVETVVRPAGALIQWYQLGTAIQGSNSQGTRLLFHAGKRKRWGYSYFVEPRQDNRFLVQIQQPGAFEFSQLPDDVHAYAPEAPAPNASVVVREGEILEIPIIRNDRGEAVLVDRFRMASAEAGEPSYARRAKSVKLVAPRLFVDDRLLAEQPSATYAGGSVWFWRRGHGRVLVAAEAQGNDCFVEHGKIEDRRIEFELEGVRYAIESEQAVGLGSSQPAFVCREADFPENELFQVNAGLDVAFGAAGPAWVLNEK